MAEMFLGFFVVWNPQHGSPQYKHDSAEDAKAEAKRLAAANPEQEFYVLGAIGKARCVSPVEWTEADELPF